MGRALAQRLGLPFYDKDEILEALFESLGVGDAQWRKRLSRAADEVLRRQGLGAPGAVLASWWRHPLSPVESGTSSEWLTSLPGEVTELHCQCAPEVALGRFVGRRRHEGHLDSTKSPSDLRTAFELSGQYGPLGIGRVITVNTEQPVDLNAVLKEIGASTSAKGER